MMIIVDERIVKQFDNVQIGVLILKDVNNEYGSNFSKIDEILREEEKKILDEFKDIEIPSHENIKIWRNIYAKFGAKPSKFRSSIESLIRTVLSDKSDHKIKRISPLVDLYNYISLKYRLPVGGDDLDKVEGNLRLTIADGTEPFRILSAGEYETEIVNENEVIYRDDIETLCRRWNWRECNKTRLTEESKNICLFVESSELYDENAIHKILEEMESQIKTFCGGTSQRTVLNKDNLKYEI
ncbi:MAG: phenylalanine--tRNA ligase beta subunit-related protein [Lachnospiraceae bacterium]|nr:phenylalanine--tRNA ligase beta subunit-related protein [Lachnospiraceae bacterium]